MCWALLEYFFALPDCVSLFCQLIIETLYKMREQFDKQIRQTPLDVTDRGSYFSCSISFVCLSVLVLPVLVCFCPF